MRFSKNDSFQLGNPHLQSTTRSLLRMFFVKRCFIPRVYLTSRQIPHYTDQLLKSSKVYKVYVIMNCTLFGLLME